MKRIEIENEASSDSLAVLLKDGSLFKASAILGGGAFIGGGEIRYEVHLLLDSGEDATIYQDEIAAVIDLENCQQVEFGNPYVARDSGDHPRAAPLF